MFMTCVACQIWSDVRKFVILSKLILFVSCDIYDSFESGCHGDIGVRICDLTKNNKTCRVNI